MDMNDPPPDDEDLLAVVAGLVDQARLPSLEDRRASVEQLYELAYKVGPKIAAAIPALIDALFDPDAKLGESALWALQYCKPDSIEPLIECLAHPQAFVRERAAHSLGNMGDTALMAAPALRKLLSDRDQSVRARSAWALGLLHDWDPATIRTLFDNVEKGTTEDKAAALHALGNIARELDDIEMLGEHVPLVMSCLDHDDSDVRWSALYLVKSLGLAPQVHADLLSMMLRRDESSRITEACLGGLKELAPSTDLAALVPKLTALIAKQGTEGSLACEVLSVMRPAPRDAIGALIEALEVDDLVLPAASALWALDKRVGPLLPALERVFDDNGEAVCDLVCTIGPAAAPLLPKLIGALSEENWDLQWAAADALGAVASSEPSVMETLVEALGHPSLIVRSASARALAQMGISVVPRLKALVANETDRRNAWAAYALGEMGLVAVEALPELRAGMSGDEEPLSGCCAIAVALIAGGEEAVPYLISILAQEDPSAPRRAAAAALGQLGPAAQSAVAVLESLLGDEDFDVHQAAEGALEAIRGAAH